MNEQDLFIKANNACNQAVQQIKDEQWEDNVPDVYEWRFGTSEPVSLRTAVNYIAYDNSWVPDMMAGMTMDQAGHDKYDGDLLGDSPKDRFADITARANRAVEDLIDPAQMVHFSYGSYPAAEALTHVTSFRGMRAFDIANFINGDTTLGDDLVQGLWDQLYPNIDQWRAMGVFGPATPIADDAPLQDRLLCLTGRQPRG